MMNFGDNIDSCGNQLRGENTSVWDLSVRISQPLHLRALHGWILESKNTKVGSPLPTHQPVKVKCSEIFTSLENYESQRQQFSAYATFQLIHGLATIAESQLLTHYSGFRSYYMRAHGHYSWIEGL